MKCEACGSVVHGKFFRPESLPIDEPYDPDGRDRDFSFCPVCGESVE